MWSDNETNLDLLNVSYLVSAVTDTVQSKNLLPITIGVFGDWGSGKSSIMSMAQKDLEADEKVLCLSFNGWLFEGYEDAKAALMGSILDGIREKRTLGVKGKDLMAKLAKRVNWFSLMGMVTKHAATFTIGDPITSIMGVAGDVTNPDNIKVVGDLVDEAKGVVKDEDESQEKKESFRQNVREFRSDFGKLLKETKIETLVIFIDDLDRCLPDTVIETLEAVRLFLFVEGTAFVICADETLVENAVQRRFPEPLGIKNEIAQNYLEKLVQVPVRIPPLGPNEVRSYMNLLFAQLRMQNDFSKVHEKALLEGQNIASDSVLDYEWFQKIDGLPSELIQDLDLTERIGANLGDMLSGNPRQIKRFLNTLILRMRMSERRGAKLDQGILAKLMVLEYKKKEAFGVLANLQGGESGQPADLALLEGLAKKEKAGKAAEDEPSEKVSTKEGNGTQKPEPDQRTKGPSISIEFQAWLDDPWQIEWLASDPVLSSTDLRPYFYVSRDRIGLVSGPKLQLSPEAQEILKKLISRSDTERMNGLTSTPNLSSADANAILQALVERARKADEFMLEDAPVNILLAYAQTRPDIASEAVLALGRVPEVRLGPGVAARLSGIMQKVPNTVGVVNRQLQKFSQSTENLALASAAKSILNR